MTYRMGAFLMIGLMMHAVTGQEDSCNTRRLIELSEDYGEISSSDVHLHTTGDCQLWRIIGSANETINIRISNAEFDPRTCSSGSRLLIGPVPFLDICKLENVSYPLMYKSEKNNVWIKYQTGSSGIFMYQPPHFTLEYIMSFSSRCTFKCVDKSCISDKWVCNQQNECRFGEDEFHCFPDTSTGKDDAPTALIWPPGEAITLVLPDNSCYLYGNYSTDDGGIVKYVWKKFTSTDLSADMQGSVSPILYLSNLEAGVYVISLTVTDTKGQTGQAYKHVIVTQDTSIRLLTTTSPKPKTSLCEDEEIRCNTGFYVSCVSKLNVCDGIWHCRNGEDESESSCSDKKKATSIPQPTEICSFNEIYCYVPSHLQYKCLHNIYKCDGKDDCQNSEDEDPALCGNNVCNKRLEEQSGWFVSPGFPNNYPPNLHCSWVIHHLGASPGSIIQLRKVSFYLEDQRDTDYFIVYDGPDSTYKQIGTYYGGYANPPNLIESTSNWMNIEFVSDSTNEHMGFNFTYQIKGYCLPSQQLCDGEINCYDITKDRCNGIWDCPQRGSDEIGCDHCNTDYSCGDKTNQCYTPSERCNGLARCSNSYDEYNCTSVLCGSHNGTFLCDNRKCIYESWTCDQRDDCGDNSDEKLCTDTSSRVIIAAICGSMICALLLVILVGCSCKLYYLRHMDHHRHVRHETPMSRLYAEFLRRRAPPPYHEAMLTSRNFDEVQQEYLEQMRNTRQSRRSCCENQRRSRNEQNQSPSDMVRDINTRSTEVDETGSTTTTRDSDSMQLHNLHDENQNNTPNDPIQSASETNTDSDDESETDLGDEGHGPSQGQNRLNGDFEDSDDENILIATGNVWPTHASGDEYSDDRCILDDESPGNMMPKIETNAALTVISNSFADMSEEENILDVCERNFQEDSSVAAKPDSYNTSTVIPEASNGSIQRNNSHGSLESADYETCSENEVPLVQPKTH